MTTDRFVLDASVAAKWFLREDHFLLAGKLLDKFLAEEIEFHAPVILQYELGNLLTKAQRMVPGRITPEKAVEAYQSFFRLPIIFHEMNEESGAVVLEFANRFRRSFYDSAYICLSVRLGCQWLTSERSYRGQLPDGFPKDNILPLESLSDLQPELFR